MVLGGMASLPGAVLGALVLSAVPEILRAINDYRMVLYGLLMVLMMIYRPQGFWGMQRRLKNAYKYSVGGKDHA